MDEAVNPESRKAQEQKYIQLVQADGKMAEEYVTQLDQTKRNAQQGELGQQLAQTKIDGIKNNFAQIAENIKNEVEILGRENDMNNADEKAITDPKVQLTALAEIEARAKKYTADIE